MYSVYQKELSRRFKILGTTAVGPNPNYCAGSGPRGLFMDRR